MFQNILLAFDGSESAHKAAHLAAGISRCSLSPVILRVVVAYDPLPAYLGEPNLQKAIDERMKEAETVMEQALKAIGETPAEIHTEILEGPAADAILRVAETRGSDLIVMGSRGLGQIGSLLLGSQSQKVVNHAPCPVLIAR
ncbi:MAG: universal stress protein [Anaerolineales bacterium]|nr:universal stress protein [Anaerolineales bacterium]MCX7755192.1 universal stress protein [Anaerolineales bacterium]MDW8278767.1 universal stress protein [Anaerolineales bacterium]